MKSPAPSLSNARVAWPVRAAAAALLAAASRRLDRIAQHLAAPAPVDAALRDLPHVEFHAGAGAIEGALYVDGQLVGTLPGINRL